jgi:eukaryotic translation initiation factor 2-alpha kinase 4
MVIAASKCLYSLLWQARKEREAEEAEKGRLRATQLAEQLDEQIKVDTQKQQQAREKLEGARKRGYSDATAVPPSGDIFTESFNQEIVFGGVTFQSVKIFHPYAGKMTPSFPLFGSNWLPDSLGMTYLADPICDDVNMTLPLELHAITFNDPYYTTSQGTISSLFLFGWLWMSFTQEGKSWSSWRPKSNVWSVSLILTF